MVFISSIGTINSFHKRSLRLVEGRWLHEEIAKTGLTTLANLKGLEDLVLMPAHDAKAPVKLLQAIATHLPNLISLGIVTCTCATLISLSLASIFLSFTADWSPLKPMTSLRELFIAGVGISEAIDTHNLTRAIDLQRQKNPPGGPTRR